MGRRSKKYRQTLNSHAKKRAAQRYGVDLTNHDIDMIVEKIKSGEAEFIKGYTNTRTVHKVEYDGVELPILYSRTLKRIVTVLPKRELKGD